MNPNLTTTQFSLCEHAVVPQIPLIEDVLLLVGIYVDDQLRPTVLGNADAYEERMARYLTTAANGHLYGRHTLLVAAEIEPWARDWDRAKQSLDEHTRSMVRRAAEVIIAMTPDGWEDHHMVHRAREALAHSTA